MDAAIVPGRVGNATLGMTPEATRAVLGEPRNEHGRRDMVFMTYDGLVVTFYDGLANMLIVESPTLGFTESGVSVGMGWDELQRRVGALTYDGDEGLWKGSDGSGIGYEVARPARDDEQPIEPPLVAEQYEVLDPLHAVVRRIYVM